MSIKAWNIIGGTHTLPSKISDALKETIARYNTSIRTIPQKRPDARSDKNRDFECENPA
jgi:hypothetical protein